MNPRIAPLNPYNIKPMTANNHFAMREFFRGKDSIFDPAGLVVKGRIPCTKLLPFRNLDSCR